MGTQRRGASRVNFERGIPTYIMAVDGSWRRNCVMKDVSATGCRLTIKGDLTGLDLKQFFLVLSATGLAYRRCELAWMDEDKAGVRFIAPSEKNLTQASSRIDQPA